MKSIYKFLLNFHLFLTRSKPNIKHQIQESLQLCKRYTNLPRLFMHTFEHLYVISQVNIWFRKWLGQTVRHMGTGVCTQSNLSEGLTFCKWCFYSHSVFYTQCSNYFLLLQTSKITFWKVNELILRNFYSYNFL